MNVIEETIEIMSEVAVKEVEETQCNCDVEDSTFYQNHGCCEYCYFV